MLDRGYERGSELLESSFFEKVKEEIKVQPIRTKKEENKEAKKERPRMFLVQPRKIRELDFWRGARVMQRREKIMTHLFNFWHLYFSPPYKLIFLERPKEQYNFAYISLPLYT